MADESTPLIQVVRVAPQRARYNHSIIRRFCTIALGSSLITVVILFLLPLSWLPGPHHRERPRHDHKHSSYPHKQWPKGCGIDYEELQEILVSTADPERIRASSQYYTSGPHLAGKNISQALWTKAKWESLGVKSELVAYDVLLNYPIDHRLTLLEKTQSKGNGSDKGEKFKTIYEVNLEEDVLKEDPTTGLKDRVPTFHGYSANGNVTGQFVYVNYGTFWDFQDLQNANVSLKGKIAIAKYGGNFRGLKIKRAQELGMIGVVLYSDPGDDGSVTEENGYEAYPKGAARNPSSVERGSTQFLSLLPGDPTTPGYPSLPGAPRQNTDEILPSIPSLPISYREALPLLKALNGLGPKASKIGKDWRRGGLGYKGVKYNIGPSEAYLNLVNKQEYVTTPIWNVIGVINGSIADEVVILGNHRDAWLAGGAGDPNSGSAALNEIIRGFGKALERGWKPLRTVVFASWDGEEYALLGSTEWVEEYLPWLSDSGVAYLNVDVGTRGPDYAAAASPLLNKVINDVTSRVQSPNQTKVGQTVYDVWDKNIMTMGSGSDFTSFQDFAGVPCIHMGYGPSSDSPVYHYHSNYDSFYWMDTFGDPTWQYHATIAKVWALMAAQLIETPVLSFNSTDYAYALGEYIQQAVDAASSSIIKEVKSYAFRNIQDAIDQLVEISQSFDKRAEDLSTDLAKGIPWWNWWKKARLYRQVRAVNLKYKRIERLFLHAEGLDGRPWFKHIVFAPGLWTGYSGATFPSLLEAIDAGNNTAIERWSIIIENTINSVSTLLT